MENQVPSVNNEFCVILIVIVQLSHDFVNQISINQPFLENLLLEKNNFLLTHL